MVFGDKKVFAIECELVERIGDWVFGHILFWFCGNAVGDWEDSTDIKGCLNWLRKFVNEACDRFEYDLNRIDKDHVFKLLYDSVIFTGDSEKKEKPVFDDIYSRFHISHLGMSSFEQYDILLVEQPNAEQRCLWRYAENNYVQECYLPKDEMQRVAKLCCIWLESEIRLKIIT